MTKFHKTQMNYIKAKALFETIQKAVDETMAPYDHLLETATDESFEQHALIHVQTEHQLGYWDAFNLLREAEEALMDWAINKIKRDPVARGQEEVISIVINAWKSKKLLPSQRASLVDICARLRAY